MQRKSDGQVQLFGNHCFPKKGVRWTVRLSPNGPATPAVGIPCPGGVAELTDHEATIKAARSADGELPLCWQGHPLKESTCDVGNEDIPLHDHTVDDGEDNGER